MRAKQLLKKETQEHPPKGNLHSEFDASHLDSRFQNAGLFIFCSMAVFHSYLTEVPQVI